MKAFIGAYEHHIQLMLALHDGRKGTAWQIDVLRRDGGRTMPSIRAHLVSACPHHVEFALVAEEQHVQLDLGKLVSCLDMRAGRCSPRFADGNGALPKSASLHPGNVYRSVVAYKEDIDLWKELFNRHNFVTVFAIRIVRISRFASLIRRDNYGGSTYCGSDRGPRWRQSRFAYSMWWLPLAAPYNPRNPQGSVFCDKELIQLATGWVEGLLQKGDVGPWQCFGWHVHSSFAQVRRIHARCVT
ncbi:hypothetical protein CSC73_12135 [Pseudoxanthomonas sacheonensis]|nr:hypothetical protein CSC73_12135 [Pseudoxanthomonas sacheonensis]